MAYVYRHIRLDKNEPFYIGISKNNESSYRRAYNHNPNHRNDYWIRVFNKTDIRVEILFDDVSYDFAKAKEIELIELYKRKIDGGTLTNITKGGDNVSANVGLSTIERNKKGIWLGKKHLDSSKMLISNAIKGIKRSPETKQKISENAKMRVSIKNPKWRGYVYVYKGNDFIGVFNTVRETATALNLIEHKISGRINRNNNAYKHYTFIRKNKLL